MEKEKVLEIEFKELWDNNFAWKVTKQNEDILKRGEFKDDDISVRSIYFSNFKEDEEILFIKGISKNMDDKINICTIEEKKLIEEKAKAINEKYGITKRWRAEYGNTYYYISSIFDIVTSKEYNYELDDECYKVGNYFETEEEALEYAEYMQKKSLEWHEKRGNNE